MHEGLTPSAIATLATIAISFAALIFTIINSNRSAKKELMERTSKEETKYDSIKENMAKINVKLDALCSTTNETRTDIKSMNKEIMQVQAHTVALDERVLSLDHRLTTIEAHIFSKEIESIPYHQTVIE